MQSWGSVGGMEVGQKSEPLRNKGLEKKIINSELKECKEIRPTVTNFYLTLPCSHRFIMKIYCKDNES